MYTESLEPPSAEQFGKQVDDIPTKSNSTPSTCSQTGLHHAVLGRAPHTSHVVGYENRFEASPSDLEDTIESPTHMSAMTIFSSSNAVNIMSPDGCDIRLNAASTMYRPDFCLHPDSRAFTIIPTSSTRTSSQTSLVLDSSTASSPHSHPPTLVAANPSSLPQQTPEGLDENSSSDSGSWDMFSIHDGLPNSVWSLPSSPGMVGEA